MRGQTHWISDERGLEKRTHTNKTGSAGSDNCINLYISRPVLREPAETEQSSVLLDIQTRDFVYIFFPLLARGDGWRDDWRDDAGRLRVDEDEANRRD